MSTKKVAIVADMGESFGNYTLGNDKELLKFISTANVACGFHASDPRVMDATVAACVEAGVDVGAHPGYPDLVGFGRRLIEASEEEIRTDVLYQIGALDAFARTHHMKITHVAPHGRMGSIAQTDPVHARAITDAIAAYDPSYAVICQRGVLAQEAQKRGLKVAYVFLADRGYGEDGWPVSRHHPNGLLHDPKRVGQRAAQVVTKGTVETVDGKTIELGHPADVLLLHGDHPQVLENGISVRRGLAAASVEVSSIAEVLAARDPVDAFSL